MPNFVIYFPCCPVAPKIANFDFGEAPSSLGESVTVQCTVSFGDIPIDISWLFNGKPINSYGGVTTSKFGKRVNVLSIESVYGIHAGNYSCFAKNVAGMVFHTAELIVNGMEEHFLIKTNTDTLYTPLYYIFCLSSAKCNYSIPATSTNVVFCEDNRQVEF